MKEGYVFEASSLLTARGGLCSTKQHEHRIAKFFKGRPPKRRQEIPRTSHTGRPACIALVRQPVAQKKRSITLRAPAQRCFVRHATVTGAAKPGQTRDTPASPRSNFQKETLRSTSGAAERGALLTVAARSSSRAGIGRVGIGGHEFCLTRCCPFCAVELKTEEHGGSSEAGGEDPANNVI